jgi:hypothetical protein
VRRVGACWRAGSRSGAVVGVAASRRLLAGAALAGLLLFGSAAGPLAAATITVRNDDAPGEGFNDPTPVGPVPGNAATTLGAQRLAAFRAAANEWGAKLESSVTIVVAAEMNALECSTSFGLLGFAGPQNSFRDFPGAPRANTWYPSALANALRGADNAPAEVEIFAEFNRGVDDDPFCIQGMDWYYGIGVPAPAGTFSFASTVLHELAHGLGFLTLVDLETGEKRLGRDDIFMTFLEDHSSGERWPTMSDFERMMSATDSGDLHWVGSQALAAADVLTAGVHPSGHVRMYAPATLAVGSSVSHWDTVVSPNELMEPFETGDDEDHVTTALLADLGWETAGGGGGGGGTDCVPSSTTLCIDDQGGDRRFQVEVEVDTVGGGGLHGAAKAIALAAVGVTRGGLFYFKSQGNPEVLVKVLNGCAVNGMYWVFWSAGTNAGLTITVTDTANGSERTYFNPDLFAAEPVQDTTAFPCN